MMHHGSDAHIYWTDDDGDEHELGAYDEFEINLTADFDNLLEDEPGYVYFPEVQVDLYLTEEQALEIWRIINYPYMPGTNFSVN